MKSVAVYCGSAEGVRRSYVDAARALGKELALRGITLVYGGASVGLMGALADATLAHGGRVIGVIPRQLVDREIAHPGLSELIMVSTMHERKAEMSARSDAFIAMPGGFGTLDELFETLTWSQLGIHRKASGLLDVDEYWEPLIRFVDHATDEGFLRPRHRALLIRDKSPGHLLDRLATSA